MKAMFTGFAAMICITLGAWALLGAAGFSTEDMRSGANVRLD